FVRRAEPGSKWISSVRSSVGVCVGVTGGASGGGTGAGGGGGGGAGTGTGGGGGGGIAAARCIGAYVRPTRPPIEQSSSSVMRHVLLSWPNFVTFQRMPPFSAHPLSPNQ